MWQVIIEVALSVSFVTLLIFKSINIITLHRRKKEQNRTRLEFKMVERAYLDAEIFKNMDMSKLIAVQELFERQMTYATDPAQGPYFKSFFRAMESMIRS